jgi:hypothetical protein
MKFPIYFTIDLILIIVSLGLTIPLWKRLDSLYKQSVAFSWIFMVTVSSFCQYLSLIHFHAWRVNPDATYILPFYLGGAPIEEYLFWWFFGLLMINLYLWPKLWFEKMDAKAKKEIVNG